MTITLDRGEGNYADIYMLSI